MSKVLAVGGPKGGVGKSTAALNIATYCSRLLGLKTLLVDADPNMSSLDSARAAGELMPFDVAEGYDHELLVQLHQGSQYDIVIVDLPGAREVGALRRLLEGNVKRGEKPKPAIDAIVCPTRPELMDIRPLVRMLTAEILPTGLPYLVILVRVHRDRVAAAGRRREELREMGLNVADHFTRLLVIHDDALELARPVMDLPGGKRSMARAADREYRELTCEALSLVDIDGSKLLVELKD